MLCWVPSLFTWNYYSIVHWLYTVQNKKFLKYIYNPSLLPSLFAGNTTVIEKVLLEIRNTVITFLCSQASPVRSGVKEDEEILGNEHKCAGHTGQWNYENWRANSCSNVLVFSPRSKLKGVITLLYEQGHSPSVVDELVPGHPGSKGQSWSSVAWVQSLPCSLSAFPPATTRNGWTCPEGPTWAPGVACPPAHWALLCVLRVSWHHSRPSRCQPGSQQAQGLRTQTSQPTCGPAWSLIRPGCDQRAPPSIRTHPGKSPRFKTLEDSLVKDILVTPKTNTATRT